MYELIIAPQATTELKKLKQTHKLSLKAAFEEIKENPFLGKPLTKEFLGKYSYRVGLYRIIYTFNEHDKIITILSAAQRSIAYK